MYWGGFDTTWKLTAAMGVGLVLFAIGAARAQTDASRYMSNAIWMFPWLLGHVIIGWLGRYGGGRNIIPNWIDVAVVIVFALAIFYWAVGTCLTKEQSAKEVAKDAHQIDA
jgi:hypothetical protein